MFLTRQDGNIKYDKLQLNHTQTNYSYIFGAISLLSQRKKMNERLQEEIHNN